MHRFVSPSASQITHSIARRARFLIGLALIVVAILGGGIEIKEVKIPQLTNATRILSFVLGLCIVAFCIFLPEVFDRLKDPDEKKPRPAPEPGLSTPPGPNSSVLQTRKSIWDYQGASVSLVAEDSSRKFYFEQPTEALIQAGAKRGSPLFEGTKEGAKYRGTAYIYLKGCSPLGYNVIGDVSDDDTKVTLRGKAPRRNYQCVVTGDRDEILEITYKRVFNKKP